MIPPAGRRPLSPARGRPTYAAKSYLVARGSPTRGAGLGGHDVIACDTGIRRWRASELGGESLKDARALRRVRT